MYGLRITLPPNAADHLVKLEDGKLTAACGARSGGGIGTTAALAHAAATALTHDAAAGAPHCAVGALASFCWSTAGSKSAASVAGLD